MTHTDAQFAAFRILLDLQTEADELTTAVRRRAAYDAALAAHRDATEGLGDEDETAAALAKFGDDVPAEVTDETLTVHYEHRVEMLRPLAGRADLAPIAERIRGHLAHAEAELARLAAAPTADVEVISFGYEHQADERPPAAHLVVDMRHHYRDPHHVTPELREMTGHDLPVSRLVLDTPGVHELLLATAAAVLAFRKGPTEGPVRVAFGCVGGRHRSVAAALALRSYIRSTAAGEHLTVDVAHLHDTRPVIAR